MLPEGREGYKKEVIDPLGVCDLFVVSPRCFPTWEILVFFALELR